MGVSEMWGRRSMGMQYAGLFERGDEGYGGETKRKAGSVGDKLMGEAGLLRSLAQ